MSDFMNPFVLGFISGFLYFLIKDFIVGFLRGIKRRKENKEISKMYLEENLEEIERLNYLYSNKKLGINCPNCNEAKKEVNNG